MVPGRVQTGPGVGLQGKAGAGRGSEAAGKDSAASENEGAAGEAEDTLTGEGATETTGLEKVEPGGWGGRKLLMEDAGAAGGSPDDWGPDKQEAGVLETWAGM